MTAKDYVLSKLPDAVIKQDQDGDYCVISNQFDDVLSCDAEESKAWDKAKSRIESIVILPCGVAIRDSRHLGLGLDVQKNGVKRWVKLSYSGNNKFHISTKSTRLIPNKVDDYIAELQLIKQACIEANEHFSK